MARMKNSQDETQEAVVARDSSKEVYAPAGTKKKVSNNTMVIDTGSNVETGEEVFVLKVWEDGTVYYIRPSHLDAIDRKRLVRALQRANAHGLALWEVLKDTTLSNSQNALEHFHQLAQTYRPKGATQAPSAQELSNRVNRAREGAIERGGLSDGNNAPNSFLN